jgi:hypothetical protein
VDVNSFDGWDAMKKTPTVRGGGPLPVSLNGAPGATERLNGNVAHLASHYYHFKVTDQNVRSISFLNHLDALAAPNTTVTTQVFFKKQGKGSIWQYEHWSDEGLAESVKSFCLDVVAERIEELVIVFSNSDPERDITHVTDFAAPRLSVSNVGCWRYKGTASVTGIIAGPTMTENAAIDGTATFQRSRTPAIPDGVPGREFFELVDGALTGQSVGQTAGCTQERNGTGSLPSGLLPGTHLIVDLGLDLGLGGVPSRAVSGIGLDMVPTHAVFELSELLPYAKRWS